MLDIAYLRQFRIGPYAVFDIAVSYAGIYVVAPLLSKLAAKFSLTVPRGAWLWFTWPLSVVFHLLFRQNTAFMQRLMSPSGYHLEAVMLLFMIFMGVRNIRRIQE